MDMDTSWIWIHLVYWIHHTETSCKWSAQKSIIIQLKIAVPGGQDQRGLHDDGHGVDGWS